MGIFFCILGSSQSFKIQWRSLAFKMSYGIPQVTVFSCKTSFEYKIEDSLISKYCLERGGGEEPQSASYGFEYSLEVEA